MRPGLPELFASLSRHDVRYVLIGGLAAILHGVPRATLDVDLLIESSEDNATRLLAALRDTGLGTAELTSPSEILTNTITIFEDRLRVDVFLSIPGLSFDEAWQERVTRPSGDTPVHLLSVAALIRAKRARGRAKDLEDIADLEQAHPED